MTSNDKLAANLAARRAAQAKHRADPGRRLGREWGLAHVRDASLWRLADAYVDNACRVRCVTGGMAMKLFITMRGISSDTDYDCVRSDATSFWQGWIGGDDPLAIANDANFAKGFVASAVAVLPELDEDGESAD